MSAEEPAEPKAVKHTLDAPGSPPAAKKARAEDLKTEDTLADAEESAAAAPPAGGAAAPGTISCTSTNLYRVQKLASV